MKLKFRAWHTTKKIMFSAEEMAEDQMCLLPTGEFINVHPLPRLSSIDHEGILIPLLYTGLNDKNGKEIYKDDIVISGSLDNRKFVVEWHNRTTEFLLRAKNGGWSKIGLTTKVIGNIYENPELLKEE